MLARTPLAAFVFLLLTVGLFCDDAGAQFISSRCSTAPTSKESPLDLSLPSAPPPPPRDSVRDWFERGFAAVTKSIDRTGLSPADVDQMRTDIALFTSVAFRGSSDCKTRNQIIVPWVVAWVPGMKPRDVRVAYNLCPVYETDEGNQILINPRMCRIIGDEAGYTSAELKARYRELDRTTWLLRSTVDTGVVAGTIATSAALFALTKRPIVRGLVGGAVSARRSLLVLSPFLGGGYLIFYRDIGSESTRTLVDLQKAAKLAADSRFVIDDKGAETVSVAIPIENFAELFSRYLSSIHPVPLVSTK